MNPQSVFLLAPLIPMVGRSALFLRHRAALMERVATEHAERAAYQTAALTQAGFSFSGLLALAVVHSASSTDLRLPLYHMLTSFLCYFVAAEVHAMKWRRWHELLAGTLGEAASLSLLLAVSTTLLFVDTDPAAGRVVLSISGLAWLVTHLARLRYTAHQLAESESRASG
ncbi:MAG: hypothetical protein NTY35_15635 [Planctomycetota bacterium]|nr:hypothetical protein [Planctomycetota bacterium]